MGVGWDVNFKGYPLIDLGRIWPQRLVLLPSGTKIKTSRSFDHQRPGYFPCLPCNPWLIFLPRITRILLRLSSNRSCESLKIHREHPSMPMVRRSSILLKSRRCLTIHAPLPRNLRRVVDLMKLRYISREETINSGFWFLSHSSCVSLFIGF